MIMRDAAGTLLRDIVRLPLFVLAAHDRRAKSSLYISAICFVGAFLFAAVERLEPSPRVALILSAQSSQQAQRQSQISCCPDVPQQTIGRLGQVWL